MVGKQYDRSVSNTKHSAYDYTPADDDCVAHAYTAGAGGGLVASIATCPLDVVKTKLQAQRTIQGQRGHRGILGHFKFPLLLTSPSK